MHFYHCTFIGQILSWCVSFCIFRSDSEITGYALDALCNVLSNEPSEDGRFNNCYCYSLIASNLSDYI